MIACIMLINLRGGWYEGTSLDPRYNLSFIVNQSTVIDQPIIGVSINYRLSAYGWLYSNETLKEGVTNLGLRDQRSESPVSFNSSG